MSTTQSNASESGPKILRHFDFIYASWDSTDNVLRALAMSLLYHHDFRASFLTSLGLEPPAGSPVAGEAPLTVLLDSSFDGDLKTALAAYTTSPRLMAVALYHPTRGAHSRGKNRAAESQTFVVVQWEELVVLLWEPQGEASVPLTHEKQQTTYQKRSWAGLLALAQQYASLEGEAIAPTFCRDLVWLLTKGYGVLPEREEEESATPEAVVTNTQIYTKAEIEYHLAQVADASEYTTLSYADRTGVQIPFGWAREVLLEHWVNPKPNPAKPEPPQGYLALSLFPGNTVGQGNQLYEHGLDWTGKESLAVAGLELELDIFYHIKFMHFNGYVSGLWLWPQHLKEGEYNTLFSAEGFQKSGRKWRKKGQWDTLAALLDEHIKPEVDWRAECQWQKKFIDSGRNYFDVAFGFGVEAYLPYNQLLTQADVEADDFSKAGTLLDRIIDEGFQHLLK